MAYTNLINDIQQAIYNNGEELITGKVLQDVLVEMVNNLGSGYTYKGVATLSTTPDTTTPNIFYLLGEVGTYTNIGSIQHQSGIGIAVWSGTNWSYQNVPSSAVVATDATPTANSTNPVQSGGVYNLQNLFKNNYIIENGAIRTTGNNAGTIDTTLATKHTAMLPVEDSGYYVILGVSSVGCCCFSAPYFNHESWLGTVTGRVNDANAISGTKYVSFNFFDNLDNLQIISKKSINEWLGDTPFGIHHKNSFSDASKFNASLAFMKYAVKGFYLYGTSVSSSEVYCFKIVSWNGSALRVYLSKENGTGYTSLIDQTLTIPSSGILDTTISTGGYSLHIVVDMYGIPSFTNTGNDYFSLNERAFSPFSGVNVLQMHSDVDTLNAIAPTINDPNEIDVFTLETQVVDSLSLLTESGYVASDTGAIGANSAISRTPYISTAGLDAIRITTPYGSGSGLAFYTGNDASQYATQYVSGIGYNTGGDGTTWNNIPPTAKYFRASVKNTDISGGTAVFDLRKFKTEPLQNFVDSVNAGTKYEPRVTRIMHGYEAFVEGEKVSSVWQKSTTHLDAARQNLTLATEDDNAKQIWSASECYVNKMQICASVKVNDATSFFGIGTLASGAAIINELRVHNVGGYATMEIWSGNTAADTYETNTPKVVLSHTLSYALTAGNTYKISLRKFENETYNNTEHMDGVVYSITSFADNDTYDLFVPRDSTTHESIRNGITASCKGSQFFSLKVGDVEVDNIFLSSEYDPHAKAMIVGDSLIDGDTMIGEDTTTGCGQRYKYSCLIQSAIENGDKCFVIAGKGGDAYSGSTNAYLKDEIGSFMPKYCILEMGGNHNQLDPFKTGLLDMLSFLKTLNIEPILQTICPVQNGARETFQTAANAWIKSLPYRYVDVNAAVTTDGVHYKDGYCFQDGTHLSKIGHQAAYEAFVRELPELFNV